MSINTQNNEADYMARQEFEKKKMLVEQQQTKMEEEKKKMLMELHYMNCPKCGMRLIEIDYRGIEIDKCSNCDGIWLDAGEMEEISKLDQGILSNWFANFKK